MLCRTARTLLYLYRPGELTEGQNTKLQNHLAVCERCAGEAQLALRTEAGVRGLREMKPLIGDPRSITMAVMRGVESEARSLHPAGRLPVKWSARLQATRPALGLALVAIFATFLTPLYLDAQKIAALERKLALDAGRSVHQPGLIPEEGLSRRLLHGQETFTTRRADIPGLPALFGLVEAMRITDRSSRNTFLEHISDRYPRLASVNLEDGIDERERAILSTEGSQLLRELQSVIEKEGKDNAH